MFWFLVVVGGLLGLVWVKYNALQTLSHQVQRFRGNIYASLDKKKELANRLMDITKEYGNHEKLTQMKISEDIKGLSVEPGEMTVNHFNGLAMNFPELKANTSYNQLMGQLHDLETEIQKTRELYNSAASDYNAFRAQMPQVLFASSLGFNEAPYFNAGTDSMERINEFKTDDGEMLKKVLTSSAQKAVDTAKKGKEEIEKALERKE
jgi:Uncharacterized conserved protein